MTKNYFFLILSLSYFHFLVALLVLFSHGISNLYVLLLFLLRKEFGRGNNIFLNEILK